MDTEESVDSLMSTSDLLDPSSQVLDLDPSEDVETRLCYKLLAHYRKHLLTLALMALCFVVSYIVSCVAIDGYKKPHMHHPANALSSIAYAMITARPSVRLPLFVLSVASFCLWANSTPPVNFIDVTSILWVIISVTVSTFPKEAASKRQVLRALNAAVLAFMATVIGTGSCHIVLEYYQENLVGMTALVYGLCGIVGAAFHLSSRRFALAMGVVSAGFVCKLLTIYCGMMWGTAVFHIASAVGIAILVSLKTGEK